MLESVRVVDCSILAPAGLAQHLADLGAEVVKVEPPGAGDYVRTLTWPVIEGVSLEHWHWNRGKRSIALDLRREQGAEVFCDLLRWADVVVEGMRPGSLERRGFDRRRLVQLNPRLVMVRMNGYGSTGPYRDVPSHGLAYDAMGAIAPPGETEDGWCTIPPHTSIGMNAAAMYGALAALAGVVQARETGAGCVLEIAESDAAVAWNWLRIEGEASYERPVEEVTGGTGGERRAVGYDDFGAATRFQYYRTADGTVLLMASDDDLWKRFCSVVGRDDLYTGHPGRARGEHALGDRSLRRELAGIFARRTTAEWMKVAARDRLPVAPVHDTVSVRHDPHARARIRWLPAATHGADLMATPIVREDGDMPTPRRAPAHGQHTDEVLREVLGYPAERIAALRAAGVVEG